MNSPLSNPTDALPDVPTLTLPDVDWQAAVDTFAPLLYGGAAIVTVAVVVTVGLWVHAYRTRGRRVTYAAIVDLAHETLGTRKRTEPRLSPEPTPRGGQGYNDPAYKAQRARWKVQAKAEKARHRATEVVDDVTVHEWDGDDPVDVTVEFPPSTNTSVGSRVRAAFEDTWDARFPGPWQFAWSTGAGATVRITRIPPTPELPEYVEWNVDVIDALGPDDLYIGESPEGPVVWTVEDNPHGQISGVTGKGKTVLLRSLVVQALRKGWLLDVVDVKRVDFPWMEGHPQVTGPAYSLNAAEEVLEGAVADMRERFRRIQQLPGDITNYTAWRDAYPDEVPPRRLVVIDEAAGILDTDGAPKEQREQIGTVFGLLKELGAQGRAAGVTLIIATQHPYADVIKGMLRNNLDAKFQCGFLRGEHARMATDDGKRSVELLGDPKAPKGRGVCRVDGEHRLVQYAFLDATDVRRFAPRELVEADPVDLDDLHGYTPDTTDFDDPLPGIVTNFRPPEGGYSPEPSERPLQPPSSVPPGNTTRFYDPDDRKMIVDAEMADKIAERVLARLGVDGRFSEHVVNDTPDVTDDTADNTPDDWLAPGR